jgi:hypothetical protein
MMNDEKRRFRGGGGGRAEKIWKTSKFNGIGCFFKAFDIPYYRMENRKCLDRN